MRRASWAVLSLALAVSPSACVISSSSSTTTDNGGGSLSIDSVSASPTSVNDGETFDVAWRVSHTTKVGYVTEMGLYTGTEADLASASARDSRSLFSVAVTSGAPSDPSNSSISCTRTGTMVKCGTTNGSQEIAGVTDFTFRACSSYVLSSDETCEFRPVSLSFP